MGLLQEREWATVTTLFVSREGEKAKKNSDPHFFKTTKPPQNPELCMIFSTFCEKTKHPKRNVTTFPHVRSFSFTISATKH